MQNIKNSAIVQNNICRNLIVSNNTNSLELDRFEQELLKIYKSLKIREQVQFMNEIFNIESKLKNGD